MKDADGQVRTFTILNQTGANIAFSEISKSKTILPTLKLNYHEVNIGCAYFDEDHARKNFVFPPGD